MSYHNFLDLLADMFDISDDERIKTNDGITHHVIHKEMGIDFEQAYFFTLKLLNHVPTVEDESNGKKYKGFVSKKESTILMKKLINGGDS